MWKGMEVSISASAAALFDGGWRSADKQELREEYGLTAEKAEQICKLLAEMEGQHETQ